MNKWCQQICVETQFFNTCQMVAQLHYRCTVSQALWYLAFYAAAGQISANSTKTFSPNNCTLVINLLFLVTQVFT